uniref:Helitron helicase-like domain-containing protein n=1 Tax=Globodera rostochiensis TaxID=31243 RepID=A0A914H992_GLORO
MPRLIYCSPERQPTPATHIPEIAHDLDLSIFDKPINGRNWRHDCARRDLLLSMIGRCGNKAGHLSLLRNLVRDLWTFKLEEKKEAAFQRGQGIGLNPNLRGWGVSDAWAGYEPTNNIETPKKQPSSFRVGPLKAPIKARSWQNGPVSSWSFNNGPVGLAPQPKNSVLLLKVKQIKQPRMDLIPKASERMSPSKLSAPWMTVIKGKAVPMSSRAAPKPVNYPLGYLKHYVAVVYPVIVLNARPTRLRCGKNALLLGPSRLQHRYQVQRKKELEDELPTAAQLGQRVPLTPVPTSACVQQQLSISVEGAAAPTGTSTGRGTSRVRSAQTGRFEKTFPPIHYDADGLCVAPQTTEELTSILMPPPSGRPTRQRKLPQRYSSISLERWPDVPISCHCKNNTHTGFCASLAANHTPRYYNTLVPFGDNKLYRCPHCAALLLKSEAVGPAAFSKCCAKGQVKMEQQFYELQRPFLRPAQRLQNDEELHNQLDDTSKHLSSLLNDLIMGRHPLSSKFIKMVDRFNHELAFGTATTEQKPVPGGYQPVKMNGMVTYRLSGLNPPRNADGTTRDELCGQVWTLNPDNAIELRKRRNLDAGLHLDDELLALLHRLLAHPQLGHPLSALYYHLKRVYEEAQQQQAQGEGPPVDNLRIRLLTRGEVMRQNLPELHNIHPHQLQLPESVDQLAQLFFVDGDDGLPPAAEQGVMLKTRSGGLTVLPWWDNWIDGAICPLLFPSGGSVWKPSLPLAKLDSAETLHQQHSEQESEQQVASVIPSEEDADWQYNPYAEEEDDILAEADDNGEGEQLLLEAEPKKVHHVSRSQAARYMMQLRAPPRNAGNEQRNHWHDPHWLWWARRLAEFFVCLLNNRIDRDKFANIKKNQPEQRSILPAHLVRHFEREAQKQLDQRGQPLGERAQLGRIFLAPRTLRGSRAYYQLQFADAMAICRQLGAPHLLITFTMNSAAKEFDTMLWEGQRWYNRPDISDRLFIDKSKEFLKDIVQRQVMGPVKAWFYSVEHQERGLPHIHLCLILDFSRMQMSMEDYIDDYISAEIPELPHGADNSHAAKLQRLFRRFILDNMYHTCSPRYCLVDGKCTKHFPRPFAEQTVIDDRKVGVQYRRRPPAQSESERLQNPERFACAVSGKDNRFVVPHNRFLALKYRSHINVEWIQGDACIKYVLKYVMKGCQLAFVQIVNDNAATTAGNVVVNYDEFRQIRMARYQTPNEALLSIWGNKIVRKSHQVQHQRFHLPGQNRIVVPVGREEVRAEEERERIEAEQEQQTPLTAYFTLNTTIGPDLAQQHTFLSICNAYWYDRQANQWKQRVLQRKNHLAMLEAASAGNPEHQALRMLLLHVRGPTGWGDLYAGHATFVEAARAMGLLEDSSIWVNTILEALSGLPTFRRRLNWTAVLLANSGLLDASSVLDRVLLDSRRLLTPRAMLQHDLEAVRQYVLFRMELVFRLHGVVPGNFNSCCERLGLPAPVGFVMPAEDIIEAEFNAGDYGNRMWAQLMQGDNEQNDSATDGPMTTAQYAAKDAEFSPQLNDKQRIFIDAVCGSVQQRRHETLEPAHQLYMLTGDGGTGKTFAYNLLGPSRLQHRYQVQRKKELEDELPTAAQLGQRVPLTPVPTSACVQQQLSISVEGAAAPTGTSTGRGTSRVRSAQTGRFEKTFPPIHYDADGLCVAPQTTEELTSILMPPPSGRPTRQRKLPQRYSSISLERWPDVPISCHCKNNTHTGFCASLAANHTPRYYNTLVPFGDNKLYRCPHCAALLLKSEAVGPAAFSKCCAKGQVKMEQQFYELQRPFLRPAQRLQNDEELHNQLDDTSKHLSSLLNDLIMGRHRLSNKFVKMVDRFNHELAFGTATTEQKPVPGGYQPVKMNGMVTYRLSGLHPPQNSDGSTRDELCGQVWTLNPDSAIDLRKRRNLDAGHRLDDDLLELLHRLLAHQQIGHPLAGLYFHLKRIYEEAKQQQADGEAPPVDNLRIRLLTRGEVMRQNLPEVHNIHPHQLQLPESIDQLAQLFFVDGDDGLPPAAEQGVMLKTRSGALTVLPWWDNWIALAVMID